MKLAILAGAGLVLASAAWAQAPKASCVDPHSSYVARPLNNHDVFVRQSIGKPKPPIRLKTSCIHLDSAIGFGLSSSFTCIGLGDPVVATINGGGHQGCVVTKVLPYAPEEGDIPQKN
jgi:hypothetical protein